MILTDTHAHLYLDAFDHDRDAVIRSALEKGVKKIVLPNIDLQSVSQLLDLCRTYPCVCFPLLGIHPGSVKEDFEESLQEIQNMLDKEICFGIGETGIDLYWSKEYKAQQEVSFRQHIIWAKKYHLPLIIHVRESFDEVYAILEQEMESGLSGIFHCFGGTWEQAEKISALGFRLGIGGVVTFQKSKLPEVLQRIRPENIVLETDAPFLAPVPERGRRNESSYLIHIARKLSLIYNLPVEEIAEITTRNAEEIFNFNKG